VLSANKPNSPPEKGRVSSKLTIFKIQDGHWPPSIIPVRLAITSVKCFFLQNRRYWWHCKYLLTTGYIVGKTTELESVAKVPTALNILEDICLICWLKSGHLFNWLLTDGITVQTPQSLPRMQNCATNPDRLWPRFSRLKSHFCWR